MKQAKGRFSSSVLNALHAGKIIGIRAGEEEHRFIGVWVVVTNGRVFVRSWDNKPDGWYRTFVKHRTGTIQIPNGRKIRVLAKKTTGQRLLDSIDRAYAEKYHTPGAQKYVRGFAIAKRRMTTLELIRESGATK
jgi:hypothetical protein